MTNGYATVEQQIYTVEQAAEILQVSVNSVRSELKDGNIKGKKRFGKWYVLRSALIEYVSWTGEE